MLFKLATSRIPSKLISLTITVCSFLVILIILFALLKVTRLTDSGQRPYRPWHPPFKDKAARAEKQIELYAEILDQYKIDTGQYPTTAAGLTALIKNVDNVKSWGGEYPNKSRPFPYLIHNEIAPDPWGRPFHYQSPGQHKPYDLYSYGADGLSGGKGENRDITNW